MKMNVAYGWLDEITLWHISITSNHIFVDRIFGATRLAEVACPQRHMSTGVSAL